MRACFPMHPVVLLIMINKTRDLWNGSAEPRLATLRRLVGVAESADALA